MAKQIVCLWVCVIVYVCVQMLHVIYEHMIESIKRSDESGDPSLPCHSAQCKKRGGIESTARYFLVRQSQRQPTAHLPVSIYSYFMGKLIKMTFIFISCLLTFQYFL